MLQAGLEGIEKGYKEIQHGAEIQIPKIVMYIIRYVSPVFLLAVFVIWLYQTAGQYIQKIGHDPVVAISVAFIIMVLLFFLMIITQSVRRWKRNEPLAKEPSR